MCCNMATTNHARSKKETRRCHHLTRVAGRSRLICNRLLVHRQRCAHIIVNM